MEDKLADVLLKGLTAYKKNNDLRIKAFQEYGTTGAWKVFLRVPTMLQVNIPEIPGYVEEKDVPRGFFGYVDSDYIKAGPQLFAIDKNLLNKAAKVPRPAVDSLLLMGSSGSVGHTATSDLDYWLCLDSRSFTKAQLSSLREKTKKISQWAWKSHSTEVNFYLVDIPDLAADQLKPQGEETEGEVAPLLLKEEFYRTLLYVAGKIPLWPALPPGTDMKRYRRVHQKLLGHQITGYNPEFFLDLGYPCRPGPQECLAAAMWLSEKSQADPFKAVLKMIFILEQVEYRFNPPLLCDLMKQNIHNASDKQALADPYALLINQALTYARKRLPPDSTELVRKSAYIKILGAFNKGRAPAPDSPKARLLGSLVAEWGWSAGYRAHLDNYLSWPDWERIQLGREIKNLLFSLFSKISNKLIEDYPDQVTAELPKLFKLKAKLLARFSDRKSAVEDLPSHLDRQTLPKSMTLASRKVGWEMLSGRVLNWTGETEHLANRQIIRFTRAVRAAAWLVHNQLYNDNFRIWLQPRPGPVSMGALKELLVRMCELFPPPDYRQLESEKVWRREGRGAFLAVLNFEEAWHETKLLTVDFVYRTVWGEMLHDFIRFRPDQDEAEKYFQAAGKAMQIGDIRSAGVYVYTPPENARTNSAHNLKNAIVQALNGQLPRPAGLTGVSESSALDLERLRPREEEKKPFFIVADSEPDALEKKYNSLRKMNFDNCFLVEDGPSALSLLDNFQIDVVVARQDLPGIGGLTLLKAIHARGETSVKAFVLEAIKVTPKLVSMAGDAGKAHILEMPYSIEVFENIIMDIFEEESDPQHAAFEKAFNQGSELMKAGRYKEALKTFESCLSIQENAEVYFNLGYLMTAQGDYPKALQCFRKAARINGSFARAFKQMAEVYEKMGNPEMAGRCLRRAGDIYMERRQEDEAKEVYDQIIRLKPKTVNVFNSLGILLRHNGKYREAVVEFKKALKVNPRDENIHFNLSRVYLDLRDFESAKESLIRALEINPGFESAREVLRGLEMGVIINR